MNRSIFELKEDDLKELIKEGVKEALGKETNLDDFLTTPEVMKLLGLKSKVTLQNWFKQGLPYQKGKPNRISRKELEEFLENRKIVRHDA